MAKQFNEREWIELFALYSEALGNPILEKIFWCKYEIIKKSKISKESKRWFKNKFKNYNLGMINLNSQTGKSPKKGKGVGRRKKSEDFDYSKLTREEMEELLKISRRIIEQSEIDKEKFYKEIEKSKISKSKCFDFFNVASSTFYENRAKLFRTKVNRIKNQKRTQNENLIKELFWKHDSEYGRERFYVEIFYY